MWIGQCRSDEDDVVGSVLLLVECDGRHDALVKPHAAGKVIHTVEVKSRQCASECTPLSR